MRTFAHVCASFALVPRLMFSHGLGGICEWQFRSGTCTISLQNESAMEVNEVRDSIRLLPLMLICALAAEAQSFSSGSTGADGPLDLTSGDRSVVLPASGTLNYTTVNIPAGRTLTFQNNVANTPVIMLAQSSVNIAGTINISANGQNPGPGGFRGGDPGQPGWGPGAGPGLSFCQNGNCAGGQWVGPLNLVPNIGGSGGGGASSSGCYSYYNTFAIAGGGGGGAITIASSASISVSGSIQAGGTANTTYCGIYVSGASGAAGAIRLVANSINVSGTISASIFRMEAPLANNIYTGTGTAPVLTTINPLIAPTKPPSISFSSIGGYQVPSSSGSSFSTIDVLLPTQLQDPIPVVVEATNVPLGSPISLSFSPGGPTSTTATLSGSTASSTATLYVSGLVRSGVTYLFVLATFDPTLISTNLKQIGPNAVSQIELAAIPGQKTTYRFLRRDGTEVKLSEVSSDLRRALGM